MTATFSGGPETEKKEFATGISICTLKEFQFYFFKAFWQDAMR